MPTLALSASRLGRYPDCMLRSLVLPGKHASVTARPALSPSAKAIAPRYPAPPFRVPPSSPCSCRPPRYSTFGIRRARESRGLGIHSRMSLRPRLPARLGVSRGAASLPPLLRSALRLCSATRLFLTNLRSMTPSGPRRGRPNPNPVRVCRPRVLTPPRAMPRSPLPFPVRAP